MPNSEKNMLYGDGLSVSIDPLKKLPIRPDDLLIWIPKGGAKPIFVWLRTSFPEVIEHWRKRANNLKFAPLFYVNSVRNENNFYINLLATRWPVDRPITLATLQNAIFVKEPEDGNISK